MPILSIGPAATGEAPRWRPGCRRCLSRPVGFTDAAVHVEHDRRLRVARVHMIDPGTGQIGQCREVGLAGQPSGLEAAHLAGRGGGVIEAVPIHHGAHYRIVRQTISVVHGLIVGKPAEHGLAKQTGQQVTGVLAAAAPRQHCTCEISEADRIVPFPVDNDAGIGGDAAAMEFQLQARSKSTRREPSSNSTAGRPMNLPP